MKLSRILVLGLVAGGLCAVALADDSYPPPWRNQPGSTKQKWEFGTSTQANIPSDPNFLHNPYGTETLPAPRATVMGTLFPEGDLVYYALDNGHQGVWDIGAPDKIRFDVPNTPNQDPDSYKLIWVQITYSAAGGEDPTVLGYVNGVQGQSAIVQPQTAVDAHYWHETYLLTITPNPTSEQIYIRPKLCQLYVDEVVIDTRCIPEPATFGLAALGALLCLRRR